MSIRKVRPKCTNPIMQDLYDRMFPNKPDDEIWNTYKAEKSKLIWPLLHSKNPHDVLEGLIQATQLFIDFHNRVTTGFACSPCILISPDDFLLLRCLEPDMQYYSAAVLVAKKGVNRVFWDHLLEILTSIRDGVYTPLDEVSKKRIQVQCKDYVRDAWDGLHNEYYYKIFPTEVKNDRFTQNSKAINRDS
jgi:hypothetical protein